MRTVALFVLAVLLVGAAGATAEPPPKTKPAPNTEPDFPVDPDWQSMFDLPKSGILEDTLIPGSIVPRMAWMRTDYLFWWIKRPITPPLIQAIPDSLAGTNNTPAGAANTLFPDDGRLSYKGFGGGRVNAGFWFSSEQRLGVDATFFLLEHKSDGAQYASAGSPILARFYVNANNGVITNLQFSNPDPTTGYSGSLSSEAKLSSLWSADASFRWNGLRMLSDNTDWLFGARYFEMRESLQIMGQANLQNGARLNVNDYFSVSNQFYGGQLGVHARWGNFHRFSVDGVFKIAIGAVQQRVIIRGDNALTSNGVTSIEPTGLYAQPSNIGVHERARIAYATEATINLNYNITDRAAIFLGYNLFVLSSVMRASNAIDQTVNDSNIRYVANPTPGNSASPVFRYNAESFWLQGINIGLRFEY